MIAMFIKVNVKPGKKEKLLDLMKWGSQVARDGLNAQNGVLYRGAKWKYQAK